MSAGDAAIFDIIERWARQEPDRRALEFDGRNWTYAQLAMRIRCVASMLRGSGVEQGERFAVLDKNHPACLELTFAASLIGAVNVVLGHHLAPEVLTDVLRQSGVRVVIVGAEFVDVLDEIIDELPTIGDVIVLDEDYESRLAAADPINARFQSTSDYPVLRLHSGPGGETLTQAGLLAQLSAAINPQGQPATAVVSEPLAGRAGFDLALGGLNAGVGAVVVRDSAGASKIRVDQ